MVDAQSAKYAFDKVAEELGATVQDEACIMGENDTNLSKEEAAKVVLRVEEAAEKTEEAAAPEPATPPTAI